MKFKLWQEDVAQPPNSGRRFRNVFRLTAPGRVPYVSLDFRNIDLETWLALITRDGLLTVLEPINPDTLAEWQPIDQFHVCPKPARGEEASFKVQFHHDPVDITHTLAPGRDRNSLSLVVAAMDTVKVYRTNANRRFYHAIELSGHGGLVRDISWANGCVRGFDYIASGCKDGYVRIFEVYTALANSTAGNTAANNGNARPSTSIASSGGRSSAQSGIGSALANRTPVTYTNRQTGAEHPFKHTSKEVACLDSKHIDVWQVEFSYAGM